MVKYIYLLGWLCCCLSQLSAQDINLTASPRGFLVQLKPEIDLSEWKLSTLRSGEAGFFIQEVIDTSLKILHLEHIFGESRPEQVKILEQLPGVRYAQLNAPVYTRDLSPNDPFWDAQWNLQRIGAASMWSSSNYGQLSDGTPIVVAVLEPAGFEVQHQDLRAQIWTNEAEIPLDQVDNDQNGYVDDYQGWNPSTQNDDHSLNVSHGTRVAGIMSATSDNGLGIASVGWNTQLLLLSGNQHEAEVIQSYLYALRQRERYNATGGRSGALVVATNASFGRSGDPSEIWCAVYDQLGAAGILSVSAAENRPVNTDLRADMPTSCSSEYLITVTGVDAFDNFLVDRAYGPQTVDIAAPAAQLITTDVRDQYIELDYAGNSFAAPHLTGAIGLMYSLPFPALREMVLQEPAKTALLMRSFLFAGARVLPSLTGKIKTEARLDLTQTFQLMQQHFSSNQQGLLIQRVYPNPFHHVFRVDCVLPEPGSYQIMIYDLQGRLLDQHTIRKTIVGAHTLEIALPKLPGGIYQLRIQGASAVAMARLVKMQ